MWWSVGLVLLLCPFLSHTPFVFLREYTLDNIEVKEEKVEEGVVGWVREGGKGKRWMVKEEEEKEEEWKKTKKKKLRVKIDRERQRERGGVDGW